MTGHEASTTGLTLDTGALLAFERGRPRVRALLRVADEARMTIAVPAGVVAQAWRGGGRQARVARLLADVRTKIVVLDGATARALGELCDRTGHADIVDVSVALCARERSQPVVTSDPDDIRAVDPGLRLLWP